MIQYLITDPKYYTSNPKTFEQTLIKVLESHTPDIICFRDKTSPNFEQLATIFIKIAKRYNIEHILLNTNIELAIKLNASGVHLTSQQFDKISLAKQNDLFTIISCHNETEIQKAINQKANMITYSPIFDTPNKGTAKGCELLSKVVKQYDIPILALGGIVTTEHIDKIKPTLAKGFASIRYFL